MAIIGNSIVAVRPIDTELSSTSENAIANKTVNAAIASVRNEIGTPLVANTAAEMTDTNKIYVYVGSETGYTNGNWYYYDGSHWVSGGVYNSQGFETDKTLMISDAPADAKTVGDKFDETDQNIQDTKDEIEEDIGELSNAISQKAPVIINTASGNIASFADGADGMQIRKIVGTIVPVQSGTGDPSPTNVRPISGWDGANVEQRGRNLLDPAKRAAASSQMMRWYYTDGYMLKAGITYSMQAEYGTVYIYNKTTGSNIVNANTKVVYTPAVDTLVYFQWYSTTAYSDRVKERLVIGSETAPYEEYKPNALPINWQTEAGTIYGGTVTLNEDGSVDVVAYMRIYTATSSNSTARTNDIRTVFSGVYWGHASNISNKCTKVASSVYNSGRAGFIQPGSDNDIGYWRLLPSSETTPEIVSSWLDGSVQFCLRLLTPQTYHFDNIGQLYTYLGTNNVWIDTGAITECDYPADTKLYIDGLTEPDEDMIANANIASGKYFVVNNQLYLSTAAIAAGASIVPGTNCTATNLAEALNALNT